MAPSGTLSSYSNLIETMRLSRIVFEILSLIFCVAIRVSVFRYFPYVDSMTFLLLAFEMKVELNCSERTFNAIQFNFYFRRKK